MDASSVPPSLLTNQRFKLKTIDTGIAIILRKKSKEVTRAAAHAALNYRTEREPVTAAALESVLSSALGRESVLT